MRTECLTCQDKLSPSEAVFCEPCRTAQDLKQLNNLKNDLTWIIADACKDNDLECVKRARVELAEVNEMIEELI